MSERLFHGTPYEIHTSGRPFLDPSLAKGRDEGDPEVGHVFATPDLLIASIFAFKDSDCRSIMKTTDGPVAVFNGEGPSVDAERLVYEVPPTGFKQTLRRGQPSGKWVMLGYDMPLVKDETGKEVPGIALGEPVRRVAIRDLIEQDGLRVYLLTGAVETVTYSAAARDAVHLGMEATFVREAVASEWLRDITNQFVGGVAVATAVAPLP